MQAAQFDDLLTQQPDWPQPADFLRGLLKPCVRITISDQGGFGTQSQFDGRAMVSPRTTAWATTPRRGQTGAPCSRSTRTKPLAGNA